MDKKYAVVACEVMYRDVCTCAAKSPNVSDLFFVRQGLHDLGQIKMPIELQKELDTIDTSKYDALLLCYGLCCNGVCGLKVDIPIVLPRAHDCITLFMGSKERYRDYFDLNPGTMFSAGGWVDLDIELGFDETRSMFGDMSYAEFVEQHGREAAEYVKEMLYSYLDRYKKVAFINNDIGDIEKYRNAALDQARQYDWDFEEVEGSTRLIQNMLDGIWPEEDFLVIEPGHTICPSFDDLIVREVALLGQSDCPTLAGK